MVQLDTDKYRKILEEERAHILHAAAQARDGRSDDMNPDRDDLATDYIEMEQDLALQAIEREQLAHIESALQRIEAGTYGICTGCGEPIPPERLEILPYAGLCVRCQSEQERRW